MPLEKIRDHKPPCLNPEHNPPGNIVLEPGDYEHTCPSCGKKTEFSVPLVTCSSNQTGSKSKFLIGTEVWYQ